MGIDIRSNDELNKHVWTDENDGESSGLDADTLNKIKSFQFLRSDIDSRIDAYLRIGSAITFSNLNRIDTAPDILFDTSGLIAAEDNMYFVIDSNNNSTNAKFTWRKDSDTSNATELMRLEENGQLTVKDEIVASGDGNQIRIKDGDVTTGYGVIFRNDGANMYMLLTDKDDSDGGWNALRPYIVNLSTGLLTNKSGISLEGINTISGDTTITDGTTLNIDGLLNFPDRYINNDTDDKVKLIAFGANGGISQVSDRGAILIASSDDSLILANGDVGNDYSDSYLNDEGETLALLSDNDVNLVSNLQSGFNKDEYNYRFNLGELSVYQNGHTDLLTSIQFLKDKLLIPNGQFSTANNKDTKADATYTNWFMDYNISGSDTLTADRSHTGLHIDVDSSASGGDTANEHRVYGVNTDVYATGDSDLVYSHTGRAVVRHTTGTVSHVRGLDIRAVADGGNSDGTAKWTNIYGVYGDALVDNGANVTNTYGVWGRTYTYADGGNISVANGVYGEVEHNNPDSIISNARGVCSVIDNNTDKASAITNGYLFFGDFKGTLPENAMGIYIPDDVPNKLGGVLTAKEFIANGGANSARLWANELRLFSNYGDSTERFFFVNQWDSGGGADMGFRDENGVNKSRTKYTNKGEINHEGSRLTFNGNDVYTKDTLDTTKFKQFANITKITLSGYNSLFVICDGRLYQTHGDNGDTEASTTGIGDNGADKRYGINNLKRVVIDKYWDDMPNTEVLDVCIFGRQAAVLYQIDDGNKRLYTWGKNAKGALGFGDTSRRNFPSYEKFIGTKTFKLIYHPSNNGYYGNDDARLMYIYDGKLYGAGYNGRGALGTGNTDDQYEDIEISVDGKTVIDAWNLGGTYGCSFARTDDNQLYACGYNGYGQLGTGSTSSAVTTMTNITSNWLIDKEYPVQITGGFGGYYDGDGRSHSYIVMLTNTGRVLVCGHNGYGQCATGDTTNISTPNEVYSSGVSEIAAIGDGAGSMYAVWNDNGIDKLYGWGRNRYIQVRTDTTDDQLEPYFVDYTSMLDTKISLNDGYTNKSYSDRSTIFYYNNYNRLVAMGANYSGGCGTGSTATYTRGYVDIPRYSHIKMLGSFYSQSGEQTMVGVTEDNELWAWGYAGRNNISSDTTSTVYVPQQFTLDTMHNKFKE